MEFFSHTHVIVKKNVPISLFLLPCLDQMYVDIFLYFFKKEFVKSMLCIQLNGMQKVAVFTQLQDFILLG